MTKILRHIHRFLLQAILLYFLTQESNMGPISLRKFQSTYMSKVPLGLGPRATFIRKTHRIQKKKANVEIMFYYNVF